VLQVARGQASVEDESSGTSLHHLDSSDAPDVPSRVAEVGEVDRRVLTFHVRATISWCRGRCGLGGDIFTTGILGPVAHLELLVEVEAVGTVEFDFAAIVALVELGAVGFVG
jgi:hypothetical protein